MQIVINIPDEEYKRWKEDGEMDAVIVRDALINGIPLPKKHGRLIDTDNVKSHFSDKEGDDLLKEVEKGDQDD